MSDTDSNKYQPIDCDQHSQYELAIMRGQKLELNWMDTDGKIHSGVVKPVDIVTKAHEEFLHVVIHEESKEIRLDRIKAVKTIA